MIKLSHLDHFVLTVADIETTIRFYVEILGMKEVTFAGGRKALEFGDQKINLHPLGNEYEPKAKTALPGTADLCFISETKINTLIPFLRSRGIPIIEGPTQKTGSKGPIRSVYVRDPDQNLIEISNYINDTL